MKIRLKTAGKRARVFNSSVMPVVIAPRGWASEYAYPCLEAAEFRESAVEFLKIYARDGHSRWSPHVRFLKPLINQVVDNWQSPHFEESLAVLNDGLLDVGSPGRVEKAYSSPGIKKAFPPSKYAVGDTPGTGQTSAQSVIIWSAVWRRKAGRFWATRYGTRDAYNVKYTWELMPENAFDRSELRTMT